MKEADEIFIEDSEPQPFKGEIRQCVDIVIALAPDKVNNYHELRITLRSIETNFSGYRDIYLIGEKPSWIHGIIHIPKSDVFHRKQLSIYQKFMTAANTESISDNFLRWDDDVYLLQPLSVSDIKDWHEGTLLEWTNKNVNTLYRNVIRNTMVHFPEGLYYDIHAPRLFNKEKYRELSKYEFHRKELLTKSTYFNSVQSNPVYMKDPKMEKGLFFSTDHLRSDHRWLMQMFPNQSRYETNNNANAQAAPGMAKASG